MLGICQAFQLLVLVTTIFQVLPQLKVIPQYAIFEGWILWFLISNHCHISHTTWWGYAKLISLSTISGEITNLLSLKWQK